ncbi:MAG: homoserine O-succinyltransferase [Oscillospiraceae bacterium]|nr:homoserine O-succinyltransferase [Oscillospiraceae bacterium]
MPIKIPDNLPACSVLESENIFVMTDKRAVQQDIRPLKILILNLMPTKIATETQLLRCLSNTPLQIEPEFLITGSYNPRNTSAEHLESFYKTFDQVRDRRFDGAIITGAPIELLSFSDVAYWRELCDILDWSQDNVFSSLFICWGAQAALYHYYGIDKKTLPAKISGVFEHTMTQPSVPLFHGFDDVFYAPHSRYTDVEISDVAQRKELKVLSTSQEAGLYIAARRDGRQIFVTGHPEYDVLTLDSEYKRDIDKGLDIAPPCHYYPNNDPTCPPAMNWRSHANLLYTNWLNYYVYQSVPYDLQGGFSG